MAYTQREMQGAGWMLFASVIMITGGIMRLLDAFWAFDRDDDLISETLFFDDLNTWGWVWLVVGALLVVAGFAVLAGSEWARWFGIVIAAFGGISAMTWIYAYPIWSLVNVLIAALVIYALTTYGGREA